MFLTLNLASAFSLVILMPFISILVFTLTRFSLDFILDLNISVILGFSLFLTIVHSRSTFQKILNMMALTLSHFFFSSQQMMYAATPTMTCS